MDDVTPFYLPSEVTESLRNLNGKMVSYRFLVPLKIDYKGWEYVDGECGVKEFNLSRKGDNHYAWLRIKQPFPNHPEVDSIPLYLPPAYVAGDNIQRELPSDYQPHIYARIDPHYADERDGGRLHPNLIQMERDYIDRCIMESQS